MEAQWEQDIRQLRDLMIQAKTIVFYGGAGTSTESGIPDYRSEHGVWTAMLHSGFDPIKYANPRFIRNHPEDFFALREESREKPEPNVTHRVLAKWEQAGKDIRVITQNVDGLHQQAGHRYVLELHGHNRVWHCMFCGREYGVDELQRDEGNVPRCYVCHGIVRPNVVYFGETASKDTVAKAKWSLQQADLLIIAGTSLTTPLARRLVHEFGGSHIAIINYDEVDISPLSADLFIQDSVGKTLNALKELELEDD